MFVCFALIGLDMQRARYMVVAVASRLFVLSLRRRQCHTNAFLLMTEL